MRYTAAALAVAGAPVPLGIGVPSSRWGWRVVHRAWLAVARRWMARPISTPQMLALQAAQGDPVRYTVALLTVLRAILVRRWWHRLTGDPVRLLMQLPPDLRQRVLRHLVTVPGSERDATQELTFFEQVQRAQRAAVHGTEVARGPSLAIAALTVRAVLGESWYWNPARWATSDGYAPFAVCWLEFVGLQHVSAQRRLELADAALVPHHKDPARALRAWQQQAYPTEVH